MTTAQETPECNTDPELETVRVMTTLIRSHQDEIIRLGKLRRPLVLELRKRRITYKAIAEAMGSTDQNVYKIIRGDL
jgi:predicted transcriptional regulator